MLVHTKPRPRPEVVLPLASLIDIVFLLLIYFLLTTNYMVDEAINLKLPQARYAAPQTQQTITVYVSRQGRVWLGQEEVAWGEVGARLAQAIGGRPGATVVIKADREVILNHAVRVMDLAKGAGAARLFLATDRDG